MAATPSNAFISSTLGLITGSTPYLALYTSNPTAADTGTELTGGSYTRKALTFGSITAGAVSNTVAVTFSSLPSATVTHWGVRDAATGGTLKVFGAFSSPYVFQNGDDLTVGVGQITISLAGS